MKELLNYAVYLNVLQKRFDEFLNQCAPDQVKEIRNFRISKDDDHYLCVSLIDWSESEKESLYANALRGMLYFNATYSDGKAFPVGAFNSLLDSLHGKTPFMLVYKKSVKWAEPNIIRKIADQGFDMRPLIFPES